MVASTGEAKTKGKGGDGTARRKTGKTEHTSVQSWLWRRVVRTLESVVLRALR